MKFGQQFKTYIQHDNKNLFEVFKSVNLPIDWKNVSILDYGCNQGNYINSAREHIDISKYTGVDIMQLSINTAKNNHPDCNFIHYNKWHQAYNPNGDKTLNLSDVFTEKFDVIICYSVFTHSTLEQAKDELKDLQKLLNPNGVILFTIWRAEIFEPFSEWILKRFYDSKPIDFKKLHYKKFAYWLNTSEIVTDMFNFENDEYYSFNTYYNLDWFIQHMSPACHAGIPAGQHQDLFYLK
jgi:SAM-dependent methyltransferase